MKNHGVNVNKHMIKEFDFIYLDTHMSQLQRFGLGHEPMKELQGGTGPLNWIYNDLSCKYFQCFSFCIPVLMLIGKWTCIYEAPVSCSDPSKCWTLYAAPNE